MHEPDIDEKLSELPFNNLFEKMDAPFKKKENGVLKSMAGQIDTLCQRDLHAYFTKISWPKKLYQDPI